MNTTTLKTYAMLTKPGIIFGNAVTAIAGFCLASKGTIHFGLFFAALIGLSLVIASACVWNNYMDRAMDEKMARTRNRALVQGLIPLQNALWFGLVVGFLGIGILASFTNLLTTLLAACGFFTYVVLYGITKYTTSLGTIIGSVSGAIPPVVGYTAVTNALDPAAFLLFFLVVFWQMPHFYAIAMYRIEDYTAAGIPVLPVSRGNHIAKVHTLVYVIAFAITSFLLTFCGYTGYSYLAVSSLMSAAWLWLSIKGFSCDNDRVWARKMFLLSLFIIMALAVMISVDCH